MDCTASGGLAGVRPGVIPASAFSFSTEEIWKTIKENKDLDIPAHQFLVAHYRCEEIVNDTLRQYIADQDLLTLKKGLEEGLVPQAGMQLSSILQHYLSAYDNEASFFDADVKNKKRQQLESKALEFMCPAFTKMLENLSSKSLENFKNMLELCLAEGKVFEATARACGESCMLEFDNELTDVILENADWDAPNIREKLRRDIDAHKSSLRHSMLSELVSKYESKLFGAITGPLGTSLKACGADTWDSVRNLVKHETEIVDREFSSDVARFDVDKEELEKNLQNLRDYARNLVEKEASLVAKDVSMIMQDRFSTIFIRKGKEDIEELGKKAKLMSLQALSVMAAIRWEDKPDNVENLLVSSLFEEPISPLTSRTWDEISPEATLIEPVQCNSLWDQFKESIEPIIKKAKDDDENIGLGDALLGIISSIFDARNTVKALRRFRREG